MTQTTNSDSTISHLEWHLPLARDQITLAQARDSLEQVGAEPGKIPPMVQLVENPRYSVPGLELFHGRVELEQHDAIHILLGRGLHNKDEGFTIGFTMGSSRKVSTIEEELFVSIATNLYPSPYRLNKEDIEVFRDGLRLAYIMKCKSLENIIFNEYSHFRLCDLRTALNINTDLLRIYYALEKERYPDSQSSQRLLSI
jgi:hypothetical protein